MYYWEDSIHTRPAGLLGLLGEEQGQQQQHRQEGYVRQLGRRQHRQGVPHDLINVLNGRISLFAPSFLVLDSNVCVDLCGHCCEDLRRQASVRTDAARLVTAGEVTLRNINESLVWCSYVFMARVHWFCTWCLNYLSSYIFIHRIVFCSFCDIVILLYLRWIFSSSSLF